MNFNPIEQLIPKSDYIIAAFRQLLDDPLDAFESHEFESSFNNSFLSDGRTFLTLIFYPHDFNLPIERSDQRIARFADMTVAGYLRTDSHLNVAHELFETTAARAWNEYLRNRPRLGVRRLLLQADVSSWEDKWVPNVERILSALNSSNAIRVVNEPAYAGRLQVNNSHEEPQFSKGQSEINIVFYNSISIKKIFKNFSSFGIVDGENIFVDGVDIEISDALLVECGITRLRARGRHF